MWIQGIVTPSRWGEQGKVLEVYLAQGGEVNVKIKSNQKGADLKRYIGAVVCIYGQTIDSVFVIKDFKIIKPFKGE